MHKWYRLIALGAACALIGSACSESVGTPASEDEGFDAAPPRADAGRKDGATADGGDVEEDAAIPDAGKKDTGVKDSSTPDVVVSETGTDAAPTDAGNPDVFVDAGPPSTTLVLNEIDYDQPGSDNVDGREFVEIYNKSGGSISLTGYELRFFNGGTQYRSVALTGSIGAGGYFVVAAPGFDGGTPDMTFTDPDGSGSYIQNGPNDSIAIFNGSTRVDTITYSKTTVAPGDLSLVEGTVPDAIDSNVNAGSIIREPNGIDTNVANSDWKFTKTITPGAVNVFTP